MKKLTLFLFLAASAYAQPFIGKSYTEATKSLGAITYRRQDILEPSFDVALIALDTGHELATQRISVSLIINREYQVCQIEYSMPLAKPDSTSDYTLQAMPPLVARKILDSEGSGWQQTNSSSETRLYRTEDGMKFALFGGGRVIIWDTARHKQFLAKPGLAPWK